MTQVSIEQAMEMARRHHQARQIEQAAAIYHQVLAAAPNHIEAIQLLGLAALDLNRPDAAAGLFTRGLELQPNSAELYYNLGVAKMFLRRTEQAVEAFRRAIALQPTLFNAHGNLAAALIALHRYDEAIAASRAALAINPTHADSYNNLGVALKETDRLEEAVKEFEKAVELDPAFSGAWTNLATSLQRLKRLAPAAEAFRRAIRLTPDQADLYNSLGRVLADDLQLHPARQAFEAAIRLKPDFADAWTNLANIHHSLGDYDSAIATARKAIALAPDAPLPKYNLSLMLLTRGEFEEGWRLHESRFDVKQLDVHRHNFGKPVWDGSSFEGRTLLLNAEQGSGDTIQFVRYIPQVRQRGGTIILGCQKDLFRLMQRIEGIDRVIWDVDETVQFDLSCTLLSLPLIFGTHDQNIPASVRYLGADPADVGRWNERLPKDGRKKVGIIWAGRPGHGNDRNRSMSLDLLAPLAKIEGIWWCSLQKGPAAAQIESLQQQVPLATFTDDLTDFAETAALIENLDLVISVDTSVAHLAGALGKPTWVLLPFVPDWRWMLDRPDSPWYPTMRLFRQSRTKDWKEVIEAVGRSLQTD